MPDPRLPLAFGGASLIPAEVHDRAERLLDQAWDLGIRIYDTAAVYGDSELLIGRFLRRRVDALLISKCGHHRVLGDGSQRSLPIAAEDIDRSLQRLGVERLGAMLLHSYDREPLLAGRAVEVLRRAQAAGKIADWGYSGDNATAVAAMELPGVGVLECSVSVADQANLAAAVPAALEAGALVLAKRAMANAAWRWRDTPDRAPAAAVDYARRLAALGIDPVACGCRDWAELALRFTISCPGVSAAIVGTTDPDRLAANAAAAAAGPLPTPVVEAVRTAFRSAPQAAQWPALN